MKTKNIILIVMFISGLGLGKVAYAQYCDPPLELTYTAGPGPYLSDGQDTINLLVKYFDRNTCAAKKGSPVQYEVIDGNGIGDQLGAKETIVDDYGVTGTTFKTTSPGIKIFLAEDPVIGAEGKTQVEFIHPLNKSRSKAFIMERKPSRVQANGSDYYLIGVAIWDQKGRLNPTHLEPEISLSGEGNKIEKITGKVEWRYKITSTEVGEKDISIKILGEDVSKDGFSNLSFSNVIKQEVQKPELKPETKKEEANQEVKSATEEKITPAQVEIPTITSIQSDKGKSEIKYGDIIVFQGKSTPQAKVNLKIYSEPLVYTTVADEEGNWKYNLLSKVLSPGKHKLEATIEDKEGEISPSVSQEFEIKKGSSLIAWLILLGMGILAIILGGALFILNRKSHTRMFKTPENNLTLS